MYYEKTKRHTVRSAAPLRPNLSARARSVTSSSASIAAPLARLPQQLRAATLRRECKGKEEVAPRLRAAPRVIAPARVRVRGRVSEHGDEVPEVLAEGVFNHFFFNLIEGNLRRPGLEPAQAGRQGGPAFNVGSILHKD